MEEVSTAEWIFVISSATIISGEREREEGDFFFFTATTCDSYKEEGCGTSGRTEQQASVHLRLRGGEGEEEEGDTKVADEARDCATCAEKVTQPRAVHGEDGGRLLLTATGRAAAAGEIGERDKRSSNSTQRSGPSAEEEEKDEQLESQVDERRSNRIPQKEEERFRTNEPLTDCETAEEDRNICNNSDAAAKDSRVSN